MVQVSLNNQSDLNTYTSRDTTCSRYHLREHSHKTNQTPPNTWKNQKQERRRQHQFISYQAINAITRILKQAANIFNSLTNLGDDGAQHITEAITKSDVRPSPGFTIGGWH